MISETAEKISRKDLDRLVYLSDKNGTSITKRFVWPESIPDSEKWISDELLTIWGTDYMEMLSQKQINLLRKWESINFYSQNIHGEKVLSRDIVTRIYDAEYAGESDYLYFFIKEENEHMAMFAEICNRYGEILPNLRIDMGRRQEPLVEDFLIFCRTILFEYYVDHYNSVAAKDGELPEIVREINRYHHTDESRHILFSIRMIEKLFENLKKVLDESQIEDIARYVEDYLINQIELVYSSTVYEKIGVDKPSEFRKELMRHPGRRQVHIDWITKPYELFSGIGLLGRRTKEEIIDGYFSYQTANVGQPKPSDPKAAIRAWLAEQAEGDTEIRDDLDILSAGIIDSLKFMRFIMFIEEVSGNEMRLDEIDLDDIRSVNSIERAFLN